jgi:hypothetical protein
MPYQHKTDRARQTLALVGITLMATNRVPAAARRAMGPPLTATSTFCVAAIATTTGIYIIAQKAMPIAEGISHGDADDEGQNGADYQGDDN